MRDHISNKVTLRIIQCIYHTTILPYYETSFDASNNK